MKIGSVEIGSGHPCAVVAEISNAHNGKLTRALRLIEAVQAAGASACKFQAYTTAELVALRGDGAAPEPWGMQGWTMEKLYQVAQTPLEWFPWLVAKCASLQLPWFSSVFGPDSLDCLVQHECPVLKISHLDCADPGLAELVIASGKPLIVSVADTPPASAYCTAPQEVRFVECSATYPTPAAAMRIGELTDLWGLSSHCVDPLVGPLAVARGACYVEVHVQLDTEPSALEADCSYTMTQLAELVQLTRRAQVLWG